MMGGSRRSERVSGRSDPVDAAAVARAALRHPEHPQASLAGPEREIGLLVAHRDMLVNQRTDRIRKLRWPLHDLDPDLAPGLRALDRLATADRLAERLGSLERSVVVEICLELLARCRDITVRADELERRIGHWSTPGPRGCWTSRDAGHRRPPRSWPRRLESTGSRRRGTSLATPEPRRSRRPPAPGSGTATTAGATAR
jgi:hypothetical protein